LIWLLGAAAAACLIALRVTQRGKLAIAALGAAAAILLLLGLDACIVTDVERIEQTLHDLLAAVRRSDGDAVLPLLTDDVALTQGDSPTTLLGSARQALEGAFTRATIQATLRDIEFEFLHTDRPRISAGQLTRQGKADFRLYAKGTLRSSGIPFGTDAEGSDWSLGFREDQGAWKVSRITAVRLPRGATLHLASP
jgi:ketosteroid isomerase-like protein